MLLERGPRRNRSPIVAEVAVRECRAEDLPLLEWFGLFQHHREIFASAFARHLLGENIMLVADLSGFPVGQAWIDLTKRQSDSIGYIWAVRVFPFLRNLGIGSQLMSCAEDLLTERGYAIAEVGVERGNPNALRMFRRLGYEVVRELTETYSYTTPDGIEAHHMVNQWLMHKRLVKPAGTQADESGPG